MRKAKPRKRKLSIQSKTLLLFGVGPHFVWAAIGAFLLFGGPWVDERPSWVRLAQKFVCPGCSEKVDPITFAYQLGRLDFVAMSLTVLGVVLGLAALGGFIEVRRAAQQAASDEAEDLITERLPSLLTAEILTTALLQNPRAVYTLRAALLEADADGTIDPEVADRIADAFNGDDDEG